MKRKPRLHDGIVTIDLGKNRLVEIPRSGSEAPDDGFTRIQLISKRPKCCKKECNVRLHVNCACAFGTRDVCVVWPRETMPVCSQKGRKELLRRKRCCSVSELAQEMLFVVQLC